MMDPDMAQMMADLGNQRRDAVSAPEDDRSRRADPHAQAAVQQEARIRRKLAAVGGGNKENEVATKLAAWNTSTTFARDAVTDQLPDRYGGQGHRPELNRRSGHQPGRDDRMDALMNRVGEERAAYLKAHNRVPDASGFEDLLPARTSATLAGPSHTGVTSQRGRGFVQQRPSNPNRAPSPRAAGTIRFRSNGVRTLQTPGGERAMNTADLGANAAAKVRALGANLQINAPAVQSANIPIVTQSTSTSSAGPSSLKSVHAPRPGTDSVAAPTQTPVKKPTEAPVKNVVPPQTPAFTTCATPSTSAGSKPPLTPATSTTSTPPKHDYAQKTAYFNLALWYAAHPGKECDIYHGRFPDREQYHSEARDKLTREAIHLAYDADEEAIKTYIDLHKEREWIVTSAVKARHQIEEESQEEIDAYCAAHPRQKFFLVAAKHVFKPKSAQPASNSVDDTPQRQRSPSSTSSSGSSMESASTTISVPDTLLSAAGALAVAFYDVAGRLLGNHQLPLKVPAFATLNIVSKSQRFDPRELIESIEGLAENMQAPTQATMRVQGARLADDGLWEEIDEEL